MFLLYGANGYMGELIARAAVEAGLRPVLAGRNGDAVSALAGELELRHHVLGLRDAAALDAVLGDVPLVLNCAGPFTRTSRPLVDACMRTGTHYLDITAEIPVVETVATRNLEARTRSIMLLPGVGSTVAVTDCLAAHLKARLPGATRLALAMQASGRPTRGTIVTAIENVYFGGLVRRDGRYRRVPAASKTLDVDFGRGPIECTLVPWADLATAYYGPDYRDIEVYFALPERVRRLLVASRRVGWLFALAPVKALARRAILARSAPGPTPEERAAGWTVAWGEASDPDGGRAAARLRVPEPSATTVHTALAAVRRALDGEVRAGFQTPSTVFGPDFVLGIDGAAYEDLA